MQKTGIQKLKQEFKDRLFFYPADALYILELARGLRLPKEDAYKLYSIMGAAELRNTLPLYKKQDFARESMRINLHLPLPDEEDKILNLLDSLAQIADRQIADVIPPLTVAFISSKAENHLLLLKLLVKNTLQFQNLRFVLGAELPTSSDFGRFNVLLYGFNPFSEKWRDYILVNRKRPRPICRHNNTLFEEKFGFFALSAEALPVTDSKCFIEYLVDCGVTALETCFETPLFSDDEVKALIDKFGLLETGGCKWSSDK